MSNDDPMSTIVSQKTAKRANLAASNDAVANLPELSSRYEICDEIGHGGVCRVYIGVDRHFSRQVALKILRSELQPNDETVKRFLKEGSITSKLDHPGIVPVHDIGRLHSEIFFSMAKIDGQTLRELLRAREADPASVPKHKLLRIFEQVCQIVAYAHSRHIAHRDLKPENIMIGEYNKVYVMDWGIAKDFREGEVDSNVTTLCVNEALAEDNLTAPGQAKGTPNYMSPEQAMGLIKQVDYRSDVFSLGIILYEILSGKNPFQSGALRETLNAIKTTEVTPLTRQEASKELDSICRKALDKTPENRYADAAPFARDVRRALDFQPISIQRDGLAMHFIKFARREKAVSALFVMACLLATFIIFSRLEDNQEVHDMLSRADIHAAQVAEYHVKLAELEDALLTVPVAEYDDRVRQIREYRMQKIAHSDVVRALLSLALKNRGRQVPQAMVVKLKTVWLDEINDLIQQGDVARATLVFEELQELEANYPRIVKWTRDERRRLLKFETLVQRNTP